MMPKGKAKAAGAARKRGREAASAASALEGLRSGGQSMTANSEAWMKARMLELLEGNLSRHVKVMIYLESGACDVEAVAEECPGAGRVTTQNKFFLAPREVYDEWMEAMDTNLHRFMKDQNKPCKVLCFGMHVMTTSALPTKRIAELVQWGAWRHDNYGKRLSPWPADKAEGEARVGKLAYFMLDKVDGRITHIVYIMGERVAFPESLNPSGDWKLEHPLDFVMACISTPLQEIKCVKIFAQADVAIEAPLKLARVLGCDASSSACVEPASTGACIENGKVCADTRFSEAGSAGSERRRAAVSPPLGSGSALEV